MNHRKVPMPHVGVILIDWGLTPFPTFVQSYQIHHLLMCFHVSPTQLINITFFTSNWLLFHTDHWWKTNEACHRDFSQTSERMLAVLGFEPTHPWLTARVATGWATGAPLGVLTHDHWCGGPPSCPTSLSRLSGIINKFIRLELIYLSDINMSKIDIHSKSDLKHQIC